MIENLEDLLLWGSLQSDRLIGDSHIAGNAVVFGLQVAHMPVAHPMASLEGPMNYYG